jgi:hypothetical protein
MQRGETRDRAVSSAHKTTRRIILFLRLRLCFWYFLARYCFQFAADYVGGKTRAQEAAIHRRDFVFVNFAAEGSEFPPEALADNRSFVSFLGRLRESGFDVAVWDSSGAQVARNTKFSLAADFRALAGKLFGKSLVVDHLGPFEAVHHGSQKLVVFGSPAKQLFHLVDRIRAAHQSAHRGFI